MRKKYFQKLALLLDRADRLLIVKLFLAFMITSIIETAGVASVLPVISMVASEDSAASNYLSSLFSFIGVQEPNSQKAIAVCIFIGIIILANILGIYILRASCRASNTIEKNISARLLKGYLSRPYKFFLVNHTSNLHRNVLTEVSIIKTGVIMPFLNIFSKALTALFILALLIYVSPAQTLSGLLLLGALYFGLTMAFQKKLAETGRKRYALGGTLNKLTLESLAGIREVKLFGAQKQVVKDFNNTAEKLARYKAYSQFISGSPRYIIEAFILTLAGIFLIHSIYKGMVLVDYLPLITLYAVAVYRMMPLFQAIYVGVSSLNFNYGSLEKVVAEFERNPDNFGAVTLPSDSQDLTDIIKFSDVNFFYDGKNDVVLKNINFEMRPGEIVGLFGQSGSGKTTLLDLMLGLIKPASGKIQINSHQGSKELSDIIGYVPQKLYLLDSTVAENIAFGQLLEDINLERVQEVCKMAQIEDFIQTLEDGYLTQIGENASRLSGGQRQRLAIARALYNNPEILILDEATNGLDQDTEENILNNILSINGKTIVLVSHHKSVMNFCDKIYVLSKGQIEKTLTKEEFKNTEGK